MSAIGLDVGGSTVRAALVDEHGTIRARARHGITDHNPTSVLALSYQAAREVAGEGVHALPVVMGFAAQLLVETGTVAVAPNFGWRDVPLGGLLRERFGRPVRLVNDLDAITYGEAQAGAGKGAHDVLCVFVGTGVGMGAVVQGRIVEGADGLATELGHTKVASPHDGRPCGCGERGCLEAYTGGRYLPSVLADRVAAGVPSSLRADSSLDARTIDDAASAGDPAARGVMDEAAHYLGFALGNMVTVLNPRVLVVGGGVLMNAPRLRTAALRIAMDVAAIPARVRVQAKEAALGDDAGLVGAALLGLHA